MKRAIDLKRTGDRFHEPSRHLIAKSLKALQVAVRVLEAHGGGSSGSLDQQIAERLDWLVGEVEARARRGEGCGDAMAVLKYECERMEQLVNGLEKLEATP